MGGLQDLQSCCRLLIHSMNRSKVMLQVAWMIGFANLTNACCMVYQHSHFLDTFVLKLITAKFCNSYCTSCGWIKGYNGYEPCGYMATKMWLGSLYNTRVVIERPRFWEHSCSYNTRGSWVLRGYILSFRPH